jgi:predicted metal-dependent phosphoesterase TrpH
MRSDYPVPMKYLYDLHSHSTASDGTLSPAELVKRAQSNGVDVLALTDHDSTEGVAEAEEMALRLGVDLIPGVEVSVSWDPYVIHVVGLGVDTGCRELQQGLLRLREQREERAVEMGRRLQKKGIEGAYEGAKALCNGHLISRTHFARFLVDKGYVDDVSKVFSKYLVNGMPGFVPGNWASLEEVICWIKTAGGQAVIAHPARYPFTRTKLRNLLGEFKELGGKAIEVVSGNYTRDNCLTMARHAREFELMGSVGSDFHGPQHSRIELGRVMELPEKVVPIWHDWNRPSLAAAL